MNVNQMYPSKYLKGAELSGPVTVTIANVRTEQIYRPGEGKVNAFVMYCEKASRGVILGKVLAMQIAEITHEPDTDLWTGFKVTLYPQPMVVAGKPVVAIRARAATNGKGPQE